MDVKIRNLKVGDRIHDHRWDKECVVLEIFISKGRPLVKAQYIPDGGQVIAAIDLFWPIKEQS